MESMIYMEFDVVPTVKEHLPKDLKNTRVLCWVLGDDFETSKSWAKYKIEQSGWSIVKSRLSPIFVTQESFKDKDLGLKHFNQASKQGLALVFVGVSNSVGSKDPEPISLPFPKELDWAKHFEIRRDIRGRGGCLFYDTAECDQVIEAHSIQKSGALSLIAKGSEVYTPSTNLSDLKKNAGRITFQTNSARLTSTFRGFCKKHDNEIFRPIDSQPLLPTHEQAMLYGYRSLCRELTAKRDALKNYENQLANPQLTDVTRNLISSFKTGTEHGYLNLLRQKDFFDASHRASRFSDIRYVAFLSNTKPNIVFSGGIFPDYGFYGEKIQDLSKLGDPLDLLTFSFAPTTEGWAFLFSWHKDSDKSCERFLASLAYSIRTPDKIEDLLFQLLFSSCENLAISPEWFSTLSTAQKRQLEDVMSSNSSPFSKIGSRQPPSIIQGISDWRFHTVTDSR